jgi:RNA polymerase sigma-70 factor (ECF subfamily)
MAMRRQYPIGTGPAEGLAERVRAGDVGAERELLESFGPAVRVLLEQRVGNRDLARDLYQDAFRVVLMRLRSPGLSVPENLASFVRHAAINVALVDRRKRFRRQRYEAPAREVESTADAGLNPLERLADDELRRAVRSLIRELPIARDRELLWRHYVLEQDKIELCAVFGLSTEHFDRVISRARQRLRDLLRQPQPPSEHADRST